jgi:hypothetical protein
MPWASRQAGENSQETAEKGEESRKHRLFLWRNQFPEPTAIDADRSKVPINGAVLTELLPDRLESGSNPFHRSGGPLAAILPLFPRRLQAPILLPLLQPNTPAPTAKNSIGFNMSDDPSMLRPYHQNAILACVSPYLSATCKGVFVTPERTKRRRDLYRPWRSACPLLCDAMVRNFLGLPPFLLPVFVRSA